LSEESLNRRGTGVPQRATKHLIKVSLGFFWSSPFSPLPVVIAKSGISRISRSITEKTSYREMPCDGKKPHSTSSEHEDS